MRTFTFRLGQGERVIVEMVSKGQYQWHWQGANHFAMQETKGVWLLTTDGKPVCTALSLKDCISRVVGIPLAQIKQVAI